MKNNSILIGALTITAILMGVILLSKTSQQSQAMMTATGGDFTLLTAGPGGDEALTIIDNRSQRMLVYTLNTTNNTLEVLAGLTSAQFQKAFAKPGVPR